MHCALRGRAHETTAMIGGAARNQARRVPQNAFAGSSGSKCRPTFTLIEICHGGAGDETRGHLGIARPVFGFGCIITAARARRFNKIWKPGDFELVD